MRLGGLLVALALGQGLVVLVVLPGRSASAQAGLWTGSLGIVLAVAVAVQAAMVALAVHVVVRQQRMDVAEHGATRRASEWWALERWACLAVTALAGDVVALVVGVARGAAEMGAEGGEVEGAGWRAVLVAVAVLAGPALAAATGVRWLVARSRVAVDGEVHALATRTRTSVVGRRIHPERIGRVPTVVESTGPGRS
ncbi:hypothetical protein GCM10009846_19400 [Agrococcus versicolor]|uniref:Uncharacterized protein n=1 Tax=Agrococcus versicolor TaxID=501482 RepID=A0ABP5MN85_9MICO